ncbi:hypothetical protein [Rudaea sp.]|uniref:hypothetical protein n=1 Tax=Rudaea sp. TaxID=2136325 RepID=UPI002ED56AB3
MPVINGPELVRRLKFLFPQLRNVSTGACESCQYPAARRSDGSEYSRHDLQGLFVQRLQLPMRFATGLRRHGP